MIMQNELKWVIKRSIGDPHRFCTVSKFQIVTIFRLIVLILSDSSNIISSNFELERIQASFTEHDSIYH